MGRITFKQRAERSRKLDDEQSKPVIREQVNPLATREQALEWYAALANGEILEKHHRYVTDDSGEEKVVAYWKPPALSLRKEAVDAIVKIQGWAQPQKVEHTGAAVFAVLHDNGRAGPDPMAALMVESESVVDAPEADHVVALAPDAGDDVLDGDV